MRVSTSGAVRPPVERVGRDSRRAEEAGYAGLFFADHLMGWFPDSLWTPEHTPLAVGRASPHDYLDPVCAIMAAAGATDRVELGLGVTDLLRSNPAVVARTSLTLDHFTDGRFILGLGAGEAENLLPYGVGMGRAVGRLEEGLEIIRLLWASEGPVSMETSSWKLKDAVLGMAPDEQRGQPKIWLAARGPRMRRIAARLADGWLPMFLDAEEYGRSLREIREERDRLDVEGSFEAALYAFTVVGDSEEQCLDMFATSPLFRCLGLLLPEASYAAHGLEHPLGGGRYGLLDFVPAGLNESTALELVERVPPELVAEATLCGSAEDIERKLQEYASVGCQHVVLANVSFLSDVTKIRSSAEGLAHVIEKAAGFS